MFGSFNEEAQAVWDFVRCQRPDGTIYGSRSGRCKKGTPVGDEVGKADDKAARRKARRAARKERQKESTPTASPAAIEKEEKKLETLGKRLAAAEEKVSSARGGVTTARAKAGTRLMTAGQRRANAAANKNITKAQLLAEQVREQKKKINEMRGIKPKASKPAPRTAKDNRRDKLRKAIDSINARAGRISASKGKDSPEFKRFVQKYGETLNKLMDEQRQLLVEA
jgi:hypothetical protein